MAANDIFKRYDSKCKRNLEIMMPNREERVNEL